MSIGRIVNEKSKCQLEDLRGSSSLIQTYLIFYTHSHTGRTLVDYAGRVSRRKFRLPVCAGINALISRKVAFVILDQHQTNRRTGCHCSRLLYMYIICIIIHSVSYCIDLYYNTCLIKVVLRLCYFDFIGRPCCAIRSTLSL